jgi:hypothetical protein
MDFSSVRVHSHNNMFSCSPTHYSLFTCSSDNDLQHEAHERTSLLPPSGISTNERDGTRRSSRRQPRRERSSAAKVQQQEQQEQQQQQTEEMGTTMRWDNRTTSAMLEKATGKQVRSTNIIGDGIVNVIVNVPRMIHSFG